MKTTKSSGKKATSLFWVAVPVIFALVPVLFTLKAGDPISFIFPNMLLFTNLRSLTRNKWNEVVNINTAITKVPAHVPIIPAEKYSFEVLRAATEDFRYPAVVRGLFSGTPAAEKWGQPGYLSSIIGDYDIPVVRDAKISNSSSNTQDDRVLRKFGDAYDEILTNPESTSYLFFPVVSRFHFNHSDAGSQDELIARVNKIVLDDLQINKILWPGFGTEIHQNYYGSQFVIGNGQQNVDESTGTDWHCAPGSNFFVQVIGRKRWFFMDPKYSAYMHPLRGGKSNMMTGHRLMYKLQKHLPIRTADLEAGDLLYNPSWEWHAINNFEGLSFGVPIRERNFTQLLRNNVQYTGIVVINKFLERFGLDVGGYEG